MFYFVQSYKKNTIFESFFVVFFYFLSLFFIFFLRKTCIFFSHILSKDRNFHLKIQIFSNIFLQMLYFFSKKLFIGVFLVFPFILTAQQMNTHLQERNDDTQDSTKTLYLNTHFWGYLRNNEYFNSIFLGETFFGYAGQSTLLYTPHKNFSMAGGIFFQKEFGAKDFTEIQPFFRFKYQKNDLKVIFGNLYANYYHQLLEPLYAFEQPFNRFTEQGLQIEYKKRKFQGEIWVDWQQKLQRNPATQEIISGNGRFDFFPIKKDVFFVKIPLQIRLLHNGGQDLNTQQAVTLALAGASGVDFGWDFGKDKRLHSLKFGVNTLFSATDRKLDTLNTNIKVPSLEVPNGTALYANVLAEWKNTMLVASYWAGNDFYFAQGGGLYSSIPQSREGKYQAFRRLGFMRLNKNWLVAEDIYLGLRVETYFDFENTLFEYNYGFFIKYNPKIKLFSFK